MSQPPRKDADNLKALEQIRPTYEKLREQRIRNDADIERLAREYEAAKAKAEEMLGTSDEAAIRKMIEDARAANTEAVNEFVAGVKEVETRLAALEAGPA